MKATTELEIKITGGRIIGADLSADGVCKLTVEAEAEEEDSIHSSSYYKSLPVVRVRHTERELFEHWC